MKPLWNVDPDELAQLHAEHREALEEAAIHWRRDWDAVAVGFVLGMLTTLVAQAMW